MFGGLKDKLKLRWLLRDEYDSAALRSWFLARWHVDVGLYSYGCFDPWRISKQTRIGRYCSFAKTARVVDINHPLEAITTHPFLYEARFGVVDRDLSHDAWLVIEDDVWVGHNATILPGCKFIGRGAVIAAGAVVNHDIPAYGIAVGMPAKVVRRRFDDATIAAIEATRWWELDKAGLKAMLAAHPDSVFRPNPANLARLARP
ncbi:MAG: CatB-related O-acetyltransferase [Sphingomonadales bacterium]